MLPMCLFGLICGHVAERVLAPTERPANIVRRRLEQAGYDQADGLDVLGADDLAFLLRFVYKSEVLGPVVSIALSPVSSS